MGTIVLGDDIVKEDFDSWKITQVRCYDVTAQEAAFVDMRHSFIILDLKKVQFQKMTGWQKFLSCFFKTKDVICKQWHGSRCACCICRERHGYRIKRGIQDHVTLHLEITGTARKGPFLNQLIDDTPFSYPDLEQDLLIPKPLDFCCKREQLLLIARPKQDLRYGDLRKHLIQKFYNTRYDVKLNNCYNFLIESLNFLGLPSEAIEERCNNIVTDVRKHKYVVAPLEKIVDKVSPLL